MVWVGIINENIIGPYFFPTTVSAESYQNMLVEFVLPEIERLGFNANDIIYMHDGAGPHNANVIRDFLSQNFPSGWIGRGAGAMKQWPARSPDFNPLDFYLWGFVSNLVYQIQPTSIQDLQLKIEEAIDNITPEMLRRVQLNFMKRMHKCIEKHGNIYEHLM